MHDSNFRDFSTAASISSTTASTEHTAISLNPNAIKNLDQLGSLTLICITVCACLYSSVQVFSNGVQLMEQFNRFIELLVRKK